MRKEKYLITGAAGFIGGNITRKLVNEGVTVFPLIAPDSDTWRLDGLDIDPENFLNVDITDFTALQEKVLKVRPTHILHLATYGVYRDQADQLKIFNTNVLGTANLLRVSLDLDISAFINTGSVYEYGNLPGKQHEDNLGRPRNMYDLAKIVGTQTATNFAIQYGLPVCTLRLFTAYGPYEDIRRLVPSVILSLMRGKDPNILAPQSIRDFVHVQDIADAYFQASLKENWKGEIINVGSGQPVTVAHMVNEISTILGLDRPLISEDSPISPNDSQSWADLSIAEKVLRWQPKRNLNDGLTQTTNWFKQHSDLYEI